MVICPAGQIKVGDSCSPDPKYVFDPKMNPHGHPKDMEFYIPSLGLHITIRVQVDLETKTLTVTNLSTKSYTPKAK